MKGYSNLFNKTKLLEELKVEVDQNPHRIDKKLQEQAKELNWKGINLPASWKDVNKFEKNNPTISVNVLLELELFDEGSLYSIHRF